MQICSRVTVKDASRPSRRAGRLCIGRGVAAAVVVQAALWPLPLSSQVVRGVVREELTRRAVPGAELLLVDSDGRVVATGVSLEDGAYAVAGPKPGNYRIYVAADGYEGLSTPPTVLQDEQTVTMELELIPRAIDLPGLEVTVDPMQQMRVELSNRGIRLDDLGQRFIGEEVLEKQFSARDVGEVLSARGLPGVSLIRPERMAGSGTAQFLCVTMLRGRTGGGLSRCALVVLDGQVVPLDLAAQIAVSNIRAAVVLMPVEATLVYGTMGGGGALLLFTKSVGRVRR